MGRRKRKRCLRVLAGARKQKMMWQAKLTPTICIKSLTNLDRTRAIYREPLRQKIWSSCAKWSPSTGTWPTSQSRNHCSNSAWSSWRRKKTASMLSASEEHPRSTRGIWLRRRTWLLTSSTWTTSHMRLALRRQLPILKSHSAWGKMKIWSGSELSHQERLLKLVTRSSRSYCNRPGGRVIWNSK